MDRRERADLAEFAAHMPVDAKVLRAQLGALEDRAPATRGRKQAAVAAFLR